MTTREDNFDLCWWMIGLFTIGLGGADFIYHPHFSDDVFEELWTSMLAGAVPLMLYLMIYGVVRLVNKTPLKRFHAKWGPWFAALLFFMLLTHLL